ncbi:hypothetical protein AB0J57_24735 [Streptomyces sp. NPDC049837]|uniref:hypothetical protein n=1 Tax=Streptomyces sp. NPDC049837 TaxID=3155277 RepID=UPI003449EBB0
MPTSKQDVSMRDLLASCAAASAVSTPPKAAEADAEADTAASPAPGQDATPEAGAPEATPERRRAA